MTVIEKKTLAEHKNYVEQMVRLSFFFARHYLKEREPEKPLGELLRDHTPLLFHALHYLDYENKWDNKDCLCIMTKANELQHLPPTEFENRMWIEIKTLAIERAEQFYSTSVGIVVPKDCNAGSFKYDPPADTRPSRDCNFHIANAVSPKSIFDNPHYLPECFILLMDKGEKEYGFDMLSTLTWLNDNPRWLRLFPQEWIDNLSPYSDNISWSFGDWGQLVTARGTFNKKNGRYIRECGELKYKARSSHCSFTAMRKHLNKYLLETDGI